MSNRFHTKFTQTGVGRVSSLLTLNSVTVAPAIRYSAGVGLTANDWEFWSYATNKWPQGQDPNSTLYLAGSAGAPTLNQETPFVNGHDDSVLFNGGKYYKAGNTWLGNVGTDDIVAEVVFRTPESWPGTLEMLFAKCTSGGIGYYVFLNNDAKIYGYIQDASGVAAFPASAELSTRTWYHWVLAINRNENSTSGCQQYLNGTASGNGGNVSGRPGTLDSAVSFTIGAWDHATPYTFGSCISYVALWHAPGWLKAGAAGQTEVQTAFQDRFWKMTGVWPDHAEGTSRPLLCQRDSDAALEKFDRDGVKRLYFVGPDWPRVIQRKDSTGNIRTGYVSEPSDTNGHRKSETNLFSPIALTVSTNQGVTPWRANTFVRCVETSANSAHFVHRAVYGLGEVTRWDYVTTSAFIKKPATGYRRYVMWCVSVPTWGTMVYARVDLDNGTIVDTGTTDGAAMTYEDSWIEDWGDNVFRVAVTARYVSVNTGIYPGFYFVLVSDAGPYPSGWSFLGDPLTYPNGSLVTGIMYQINNNRRSYSSYIPTDVGGGIVIETKEPDELRFKADDGNIGGTGSNQNVTVVADLLGDDVDYGNEDEYFVELSRGTDDWNRIWAYGNTTDYKFTVASRYKNAGCTATKVNNPLNDNVWNEVRGCIRAKDYAGPAAKASNAFVTYVAGVSSGVDTTDIYCPKALSYLNIGHDRNIENSSNYTLIANVYTYNHYLPVDGGSRERSTESERSQADGTRAIEPMKYAEESVVAEPDTYVLYREENVRTTDTHSKE